MIRTVFEFVKFVTPLAVKGALFLFIISGLSTILTFVLYHLYFGLVIGLSPFCNIITVNLIITALISLWAYFAYQLYTNF